MKGNLIGMSLAAVLFVAAFSGVGARAEEGGSNFYADLLKSKAPALVSVKFVVKISMFGQSREMSREATGVMVDPVGLVMISNTQLGGGMGIRMRGGGAVKPKASKFKVSFPGEEKEYNAILGATDSKLNLAFIRIRDLEGKKVECVEFAEGSKLSIGQELVGVERFGKGFDYAPHFTRVLISGEIKQPRVMYSISGDAVTQGLPLFDRNGKVVGALAAQSGAEGAAEGGGINIGGMNLRIPGMGGGGGGVFLIPATEVKATVVAAKKQAEEALKKAAEEGDEEEEEEGGGDEEDEDDGW